METCKQNEEVEEKSLKVQEVFVNRKPYRIKILKRRGDVFLVDINKKIVEVRIKNSSSGNEKVVEMGGTSFKAQVNRSCSRISHVKLGEELFEVQHQIKIPKMSSAEKNMERPTLRSSVSTSKVEEGAILAPIAGRISLLKTSAGQRVRKGECVCILEAMKMENEINSPRAGIIKEVRVSQGAIVKKKDILVVIS